MNGKRHVLAEGDAGSSTGSPAAARARSALADARERVAAGRVADDTLLDAARDCVLAAGVRRTTLAEIARTAKVSRMTLYRRFPDVTSVLAALMTREFGALVQRVSLAGDAASTMRERIVHSGVATVRALAADPLMRTVLDVDADLILPYIVQRLGSTQRLAEQVITGMLHQGQADGSVRLGEPRAQARSLLLVIQSFVFSLRAATTGTDPVPEEDLLTELAHVLDAALSPVPARGRA
ncbi:TetR family transcriptional regulator [Amycolatopsis antarctica]|uniref:TetR family transcriptional regulator n=1 Tax=Amycolatopsis antarctica TaxID=1854586 RepID=A0A263CZ61_9PSEU|nr:TetR/AcrR family transcriptional regulator [Amycolatopsis antarctica]OZM70596.1 TetR family transcriptional regulator [Amycolatopsis antarctica]